MHKMHKKKLLLAMESLHNAHHESKFSKVRHNIFSLFIVCLTGGCFARHHFLSINVLAVNFQKMNANFFFSF